jgi:hypothetical protein
MAKDCDCPPTEPDCDCPETTTESDSANIWDAASSAFDAYSDVASEFISGAFGFAESAVEDVTDYGETAIQTLDPVGTVSDTASDMWSAFLTTAATTAIIAGTALAADATFNRSRLRKAIF